VTLAAVLVATSAHAELSATELAKIAQNPGVIVSNDAAATYATRDVSTEFKLPPDRDLPLQLYPQRYPASSTGRSRPILLKVRQAKPGGVDRFRTGQAGHGVGTLVP
jgi:hypothetical protein